MTSGADDDEDDVDESPHHPIRGFRSKESNRYAGDATDGLIFDSVTAAVDVTAPGWNLGQSWRGCRSDFRLLNVLFITRIPAHLFFFLFLGSFIHVLSEFN